jgi:hypothetical protein
MAWFRVSSWTITPAPKYKMHILRFENTRSVTPDIALTQTQLANFIRAAVGSLEPATARELLADIEQEVSST